MTERDIFLAAIDLPDPAARLAYLDRACGQDASLRERVEALLRSHEEAGSFLGKPAVAPPEPDHGATMSLAVTPGAETVAPPPNDSAEDEALPFLAPSQRADSLGRLGHYEMLQILGRGGFGIVFRAFDEVLQRVVAVKVMAPQLATTSPARKRFLREARSSAQVRHENVVQVYEVAEQPLPYLVMEFIPGQTLQEYLDKTGPLDTTEVLRIGRQIAEGLAAAHATDLIHRDIKPANVLIESGPQQRVKITDFGLARAADDASISQSGIIAGTPMYMAPEQALGHALDQRADLFSLGSVLYQMVSGRPPFRANSTLAVLKRVAEDAPRPIREIIPEAPTWLCDIIAKLHAKKPDERFQSAREVADLLADCETQLKSQGAIRNFSRLPKGKPTRSRSWLWWLALLPIVCAFLISAFDTELRPGRTSGTDTDWNQEPAHHAEGWVQLFNGTDLTGWERAFGLLEFWKVEGGELVGSGQLNGLATKRRDYRHFHLRVEVKVNPGGDGCINCRGPIGFSDGVIKARISLNGSGSLLRESTQLDSPARSIAVTPNEWVTLELIAQGDRIETRVNGRLAAQAVDEKQLGGPICLQSIAHGTEIRFRKIEIKELPNRLSATNPEVVQSLRDLVAAKERELATVTARVTAGLEHVDPKLTAEIELAEARIRQAEAEGNESQVVAQLRTILALRQELRRLDAIRVEVTVEPSTILNRHDSLIAEVRERLARAKAKVSAPLLAIGPFNDAKAKEYQRMWAEHLGVEPEMNNSLDMKFRLIPPGQFTMGNSDENPFAKPEDKPQHRVTLTKPFYLATHETTVGQFSKFVEATNRKTYAEIDPRGAMAAEETGYHRRPGLNWRTPGFPQAHTHPVTCVTWDEANAFCEWLSKQDGRTYRLPTDAEWEYACRAGTTTAYYYGPKADPKRAAVQRWSEKLKTMPVGSFAPNPFGLHDMLGNVYEWCHDGRRKYTPEAIADPVGETGKMVKRVLRGGAWSSGLEQQGGAVCGSRSASPPEDDVAQTYGFRVAMVGELKAK